MQNQTASIAESMIVPFPSRDALLAQGTLPCVIADLYDLWVVAHTEAMALAVRLPEVFGDPPRPRITLHVARGFDDEWVLSEARGLELAAMDPEQHWTEVTANAVKNFQEYFTLADEEGWRFYLPAFLRHYLGEFPLSYWDAVYSFCARRTDFDFLSPTQIAFVREYLALCHTWEG